jgi:hypothetical protein
MAGQGLPHRLCPFSKSLPYQSKILDTSSFPVVAL